MNVFANEERLLDCIYAKDLDGIEQCMEAGALTCLEIRGSSQRDTPLHVAASLLPHITVLKEPPSTQNHPCGKLTNKVDKCGFSVFITRRPGDR